MEREATHEIIDLLVEIRDLLAPISDEFRGSYEERQRVVRLLAEVVNTPQRQKMYLAMNGKKTQSDIADEVGVTQGTVSRFISALIDKDLVHMVPIGATERPLGRYDLDTGRKLEGNNR
jgi:DNA-directed RNA polymerase specialized sigma subunit